MKKIYTTIIFSLLVILLFPSFVSSKRAINGQTFTNSTGIKFVMIPAGSFMMGSAITALEVAIKYGGKSNWYRDEYPRHKVTITIPFYLGTTEITQSQWKRVMGSSPSYFQDCGMDCPVEQVSWDDVQEFVKKLNELEGSTKYRLPTEAEWEYACRAGSTTRFFYGNDKDKLGEYAWNKQNSENQTHPAGQKKSNAWGLYDMYGNVWEWCQDWYDKGYYSRSPERDPKGSSSKERVIRGGSWNNGANVLRSAERHNSEPDLRYYSIGLRIAKDY